MRIAILGTGRVGRTLGRRWIEVGHDVIFGSRNPRVAESHEWTREAGPPVLSHHEALEQGEVAVLAVPYQAALEIAECYKNLLSGQVVIDCTNPLNEDFSGLEVGFSTSAAEQIAARAPEARLVKAFNTVSAATMADPIYDGQPAALLYCGNDFEAKRCVGHLAQELGFAPVDAGPLVNARLLEPVAMLAIYLSCHGWGSGCTWGLLTRKGAPSSASQVSASCDTTTAQGGPTGQVLDESARLPSGSPAYQPWFEAGYRCVVQLPVQWGDQDAMRHVNNTVPLRWIESARIAYLEQSGAGARLLDCGLEPILASLQCDYRRQIHYPDRIWVGAKVVALGKSSMRMQHAVWSERQQALVVEGCSVLVIFDYRAQRPCPIPPHIRRLLEEFEGQSLQNHRAESKS